MKFKDFPELHESGITDPENIKTWEREVVAKSRELNGCICPWCRHPYSGNYCSHCGADVT